MHIFICNMDKITQMMVITMEECGELTQVCSKLLRKRHTRNEISDETKYKLTKEVADVMCMIELMKEEGLIEHHEIVKGIEEKRDKLKIWSVVISLRSSKTLPSSSVIDITSPVNRPPESNTKYSSIFGSPKKINHQLNKL